MTLRLAPLGNAERVINPDVEVPVVPSSLV